MTFAPYAPHEQKVNRPTQGERQARSGQRTRGEDAAPAPGHSTDHLPDDFRTINGWGADLDPANRPAVPRELPSNVTKLRGDVKHWQKPPFRIHLSNEYPGITPVFGTSCPPHGLSGMVKDYAYQFGEGTNRHWFLLMMSNRLDVLERMIGDALRGRPDNYFAEKAWSSGARSAKVTRNGAIAAGILGAVLVALAVRRKMR